MSLIYEIVYCLLITEIILFDSGNKDLLVGFRFPEHVLNFQVKQLTSAGIEFRRPAYILLCFIGFIHRRIAFVWSR
jgi:hypothetical protein